MKICIVGDGIMGGGIVQVVAQSGYEVLWKGFNEQTIDRAQKRLDEN